MWKKVAFFIPLTLLLALSSNIQAFTHDNILKGGLSLTWARLKTHQHEGHEFLLGAGFNTHFAYRWDLWEISASCYTYWGSANNLRFKVEGKEINNKGNFRSLSFGPILRYFLKKHPLPHKSIWYPYIGIGPNWSLQNIQFSKDPDQKRKLTYSSFGFFFTLGIEEETYYKEMNPVYFEFLYSYQKSNQLSIVDISNPRQINILITEEAQKDLQSHFVMFSIGMTLF